MSSMEFTKWAKEIYTRYETGVDNAFIVTGNIGDYAIDTIKIQDYLQALLDTKFHMDFVATYDPNDGVTPYKNYEGEPLQTYGSMCEYLMNSTSNRKSAYIINYPNLFLPCPPNGRLNDSEMANLISIHKALSSGNFMSSDNIVIFLCESVKDINPMLVSSNIKTAVIEITLPTAEDRKTFFEKNHVDIGVDSSYMEVSVEQFVNLTAGLTLMNIEDILLNAADKKKLTYDMILDRKKELIRKEYGEIIELFDTSKSSLADFAGQEHIKEYFKDVVIDAIKDGNTKIVPKGVLLMGPPGTGKTYFSNCLAGDAGINFVEFKMSKILDKWVGNAEKNLEKAFSVFRALAPVGVFLDEVDQSLSRGDNDSSSVNKNMFGMFLAELSKPENRGKILWIGATNYPNKIDEALKRSGRFDKKIPFFAPKAEERAAVFAIHFKKTGYKIDEAIDYNLLASKTDGYTQAEIENVVVKSLELAMRRKHDILMLKDIEDSLEFMLPASNSRIREMEDIALLECNDLEFLPTEYRERKKALQKREDAKAASK